MNADGSGQVRLTSNTWIDIAPDWQPLSLPPPPPYDVPSTASPLAVSLVPDFRQTISASQCQARGGVSSAHGPPDIPGGSNPDVSCNPPALAPGTQAHFGAKAVASAQLAVVPGDLATPANDADVSLTANATDIRATSKTGADYNPNPTGPDLTLIEKLASPTPTTAPP